jgi:cation diffusion facilitator family transporter
LPQSASGAESAGLPPEFFERFRVGLEALRGPREYLRGMAGTASPTLRTKKLERLVLLSIAAAVATISLKTAAWLLTGSIGLLSDAAESVVNLVAAVFALIVVRWAARPADDEHAYGHEKADYLAAGVEGSLILVAAGTIAYAAIGRLADPQALDDVGVGLVVSVVASAINFAVARILMNVGREEHSIVLEADGRHLMTDVWTSVGVVLGVGAVAITGIERLDPIIALAVAANIVATGVMLVRRFVGGLMDKALSKDERRLVDDVLAEFTTNDIRFHALRTRRAGRRAFVSLHILVPGDWTVQRGHDLAERVESRLREELQYATVFTHLEPAEDPKSFADTALDRGEPIGPRP